MKMGKQREEIYRELTPEGVGLCVAAGALAEGLTFVVMGIRLGSVPLPVLVFLWGLFGFLISGVLYLFDAMGTRVHEIREWTCQRKRVAALAAENELITAMKKDAAAAFAAAMCREGVLERVMASDIVKVTPTAMQRGNMLERENGYFVNEQTRAAQIIYSKKWAAENSADYELQRKAS